MSKNGFRAFDSVDVDEGLVKNVIDYLGDDLCKEWNDWTIISSFPPTTRTLTVAGRTRSMSF